MENLPGNKKYGTLFMAANHLGNERDTPLRTLEQLQNCDLLVFEEAKIARKMLKQAKIMRKFLLFNEHRQKETLERVKNCLLNKKNVCYLSDQGSPTLCDPGSELASLALKLGASLKVIPGPSCLTAAMSACPFLINHFVFTGLLPRKKEQRIKEIRKYLALKTTIITLDTPYRREQTLSLFYDIVGKTRKAFLALDISGPNETYFLGPLNKIREQTKNLEKLNFVLIIN